VGCVCCVCCVCVVCVCVCVCFVCVWMNSKYIRTCAFMSVHVARQTCQFGQRTIQHNWAAPLASITGQHYEHHLTAPLTSITGRLHCGKILGCVYVCVGLDVGCVCVCVCCVHKYMCSPSPPSTMRLQHKSCTSTPRATKGSPRTPSWDRLRGKLFIVLNLYS
jgi:hypothetical protein